MKNRIKFFLKMRQLRSKEFAEQIKMKPGSLSRIINMRVEPSVESRRKIAEGFGVEERQIFYF